jgi:hypothetical protein
VSFSGQLFGSNTYVDSVAPFSAPHALVADMVGLDLSCRPSGGSDRLVVFLRRILPFVNLTSSGGNSRC